MLQRGFQRASTICNQIQFYRSCWISPGFRRRCQLLRCVRTDTSLPPGNETFISLLFRYKPVVDRPETTKDWTPLIIASQAA